MSDGRFNFDSDVDMTRGPADGSTPSGIGWEKGTHVPTNGRTPAAKHASATGAMAAAAWRGTRAQALLLHFLAQGRLTIAEAAILLGCKEGSVTGPWNVLEHELGWIRGTGAYFTYALPPKPGQKAGRTIHREYHELTPEGERKARALRESREARS